MGLDAKLVREARCKILNAPMSVAGHIWNFSNVIEHLPTREQKDGDETDASPKVSILYDRKNVRSGDSHEGDEPKENSYGRDNANVVDRSHKWRSWTFWQMSA